MEQSVIMLIDIRQCFGSSFGECAYDTVRCSHCASIVDREDSYTALSPEID